MKVKRDGPAVSQFCVRMAAAIWVVAVTVSCKPHPEQGPVAPLREYVIEGRANGGDCVKLKGHWRPHPRNICDMTSLTILANEFLVVRGQAHLVVQVFYNRGVVRVGQVVSDQHRSIGELTLGGPGIVGTAVNSGVIQVFSGSTLNHRSNQLVNQAFPANQIAAVITNNEEGVLNNFGLLVNQSLIANVGFLHNSGPPVQSTKAMLMSTGPSGTLLNGGTIENRGKIIGPVIGDCPGDCSP